MASSLLHDDLAEARKASATFAATVRDVLERWAHQCCKRSQITSSHIRVISKNSFSASCSRFVSCTTKAPRNAKKRAATRLRSAPTVGQSTQGTLYIRGAGGYEIFLRSPQNADRGGDRILLYSLKVLNSITMSNG